MMTKEEFVRAISVLRRLRDFENRLYEVFPVNLYEGIPELTDLWEECVRLLSVNMDEPLDTKYGNDIEYFIYELDCGDDYVSGCFSDEDGNDIDISTPELLYDYIVSKKND